MELTIQVNPVERTVRLREVHALAAGDSCSVVLEGVRGADVAALRLALYRDAASDSPVASCPSFAPVRGHPNLATGDLRLDTAEMAAWFEAVRPEPEGSATDRDGSGSGDAAERAVRTDGWLVVSEPTRTWAACRVPVVLRPGAGVSGVVDPTSIQSLVEGLVSAAMSEALASKADKATTLAGYGITDAATKSELDSVNQNAENAILGVQSELSTKADLVDGKVPANQLPSYVDDVLEYDSVSAFPATGEDGKIYVAEDTNKTYRWGGTQYVEISQSLALGETSETAYPGDKGKAAAEKADEAYSAAESLANGVDSLAGTIGTHIRNTKNPHDVTAAQVGALSLEGGTLTGDLSIGEEHTASRKLTVAADNGANGITLQGGVAGTGSSVTIGGSDGIGGKLTVSGGSSGGGKITVEAADQGYSSGSIEVTGSGASIKKDGKEVATEEQLAEKADATSVYTKAEVDSRYSVLNDEINNIGNSTSNLSTTITEHINDTNNPHAVTAAQVGAVARNVQNTVGSSFSVQYHDETGGGGDFSFGIGSGPAGNTFLVDKLYCSGKNRFYANGVVITNEEGVSGASILARIMEYGGDFKSALDEVKGLIKADAATMESLAPEYSPSSAYSVGAFVYHDGNIYQCTTAIADGGEAWNAAHWELRKLDDFFTESNSLLTATIDARLPYPLYAVPSTGLLKDRAINTTSLASVTVPDNFTDLLIRAQVASSLSVTMPEAITKYGDTFPGEAGEYLITITKTGAAEAYVRTIKLEEVA